VRPALASLTITEEPLDGFSQLGKNRTAKIVGIAFASLLVLGVAWWAWHTPADETPTASAAAATATPNVHAASPEPTHAAPALELIPKPAPGVEPTRSGRSHEVVAKAAESKPIDLRPEDRKAAAGKPDTIEVRAPKRTAAGDTSSVPEPPTVDLPATTSVQDLARLTSMPAQMPVAAPRVSQGVQEARLVRRVEPVYPPQARAQRSQGKITLSATIGADGSVRQVAVVGGSPVLAEAAKDAVLKWRYSPALLNGSPIEVQKEIIVIFAQP
jgi:TonB family protein